jgi:predicted esterase
MIQGNKDTTIPVKLAHYMKQKADTIGAPVKVVVVKNAGHNWRRVDADIDPSRNEIIDRTVQFFVECLPKS